MSGRASDEAPKRLRSDAARNRARVLEAAYDAIAANGLTVPIDEIARHAGVGAGTVYRHFPTKESLLEAIIADRVDRLAHHARVLAEEHTAGDALFAYLDQLIDMSAADRGLVEALAGAGFDLAVTAPEAEARFMAVLDDLLGDAQRAGTVRADVDAADVKTLLVGCQAMVRYRDDRAATQRALAIVRDGLAPPDGRRHGAADDGVIGR